MLHVLWLSWAMATAHADPAGDAFAAAIRDMSAASAAMKDATYTFEQYELVGNSYQPHFVIDVKFRKSQDLYMVWTGEPAHGRRLVYRKGANDGKMWLDEGDWVPTISLDPIGSVATHGQRHTIFAIGFPAVVRLFQADADRIAANPGKYAVTVVDQGAQTWRGESVHCFETTLPKTEEPAFYASKVNVCISNATHLPTHIVAYDFVNGALKLVEDYAYLGVKVDVGLTDADFDPATYGM